MEIIILISHQTFIKDLQLGCIVDSPTQPLVIGVNIFQNELMLEIYSKSLVRAIGKVLRMTSS